MGEPDREQLRAQNGRAVCNKHVSAFGEESMQTWIECGQAITPIQKFALGNPWSRLKSLKPPTDLRALELKHQKGQQSYRRARARHPKQGRDIFQGCFIVPCPLNPTIFIPRNPKVYLGVAGSDCFSRSACLVRPT